MKKSMKARLSLLSGALLLVFFTREVSLSASSDKEEVRLDVTSDQKAQEMTSEQVEQENDECACDESGAGEAEMSALSDALGSPENFEEVVDQAADQVAETFSISKEEVINTLENAKADDIEKGLELAEEMMREEMKEMEEEKAAKEAAEATGGTA